MRQANSGGVAAQWWIREAQHGQRDDGCAGWRSSIPFSFSSSGWRMGRSEQGAGVVA
jgi:hypothetical protein